MASNQHSDQQSAQQVAAGCLYVVATPIGNLADMSERARTVLAEADLIAAEDTRRTARMLTHLGIRAELISCHEHNETERAVQIADTIRKGGRVALVSDAGTPLMSDPGYRLVKAVTEAGLSVIPVPGSCAAIAALSVAGLPSDRFFFEGFLPAAEKARQTRLRELSVMPETLLFYVSVHKIQTTLKDMIAIFGDDRGTMLAREITKLYETFYRGTLAEVLEQLAADPGGNKGEFTLVVAGREASQGSDEAEVLKVLGILLEELPASQAAAITAKLTGQRKKAVYALAMSLRDKQQ